MNNIDKSLNAVGGQKRLDTIKNNSDRSSKERRAYLLFSQEGSNEPTIKVLRNDFKDDFKISRYSPGRFILSNKSAFHWVKPSDSNRIFTSFGNTAPNRFYFFNNSGFEGYVGIDVNVITGISEGQYTSEYGDGLNTVLEIIRFGNE